MNFQVVGLLLVLLPGEQWADEDASSAFESVQIVLLDRVNRVRNHAGRLLDISE